MKKEELDKLFDKFEEVEPMIKTKSEAICVVTLLVGKFGLTPDDIVAFSMEALEDHELEAVLGS